VNEILKMNFFSKTYEGIMGYIKLGVGSIGCCGALGMLIYGLIAGATVGHGALLVAGGTIYLIQSGYILFDSKKSFDISKQINSLNENITEFSFENDQLKGNVDDLTEAKLDYIKQNKKYATSLEKSNKQIVKLQKLQDKYVLSNEKYKKLLDTEKQEIKKLEGQTVTFVNENKQLKCSLDEMTNIKEKFMEENKVFNELLNKSKKEIDCLTSTKEKFMEENEKLQQTTSENKNQLLTLQKQNTKLKELYNQSVKLMKTLKDAGDIFSTSNSNIQNSVTKIDGTAENLDDTLHKMERLLENLKDTTFDEIDQNNDNLISKDEFVAFLGKQ